MKQLHVRREVIERISKGGPDWRPEFKVFGIGLSRTGTTSLNRALQQLGYESAHCNYAGSFLGWPHFLYLDAATDIPCSAQFESLYHTFEKSKFIYTVRDVDSWRRSIVDHTGTKRPSEWDHKRHLQLEKFQTLVRRLQAWESLYRKHDSWEEAYHAFDNRVKRFFENKPEGRFLEMKITDGDGWEKLCSFLEHEVPDRPFPHVNASRE